MSGKSDTQHKLTGDLCLTPHLRCHFRDSGLVMCVSTLPSPSLSVPCIWGVLQRSLPAFTACRHPKDARSIGIGRGTKCRRPMYKRTHNASTPCGSPREGLSARRPTRGRGGMGGLLYIGHRFADDRCLWSEHPYRGASFSAIKLKCVTPVPASYI